MKITRVAIIDELNNEDLKHLDQLMNVFCSAERFSFKRLLEGEKSGELIKKVNEKFNINKRYAEDAVLQAQSIIKSQKELLPSRIEDIETKIQKTEQKIEDYLTGKKTPKKVLLETCLVGLQSRLEKLQNKLKHLLKCQEEGMIPKVIFGGKKNFYLRMENKITKEDWKELRTNTLYSRGDKSKKGNLNTRITYNEQENQIYLEVANPLLAEGKKNSPRLTFKLKLPEKYFKEMVDVVVPTTTGVTSKGKPIEEYKVYSIEIKRKEKKYYVHITYDVETHGRELKWSEKITSDVVAGIDVNIDKASVSIITKQGNLLESKTFYCHEMEYVKSNRRSNISGELAKEIIDYLLSWNVGAIVLEDITLKQDHDTDKKFNRFTHSFAKNKLQNALILRGVKFGFGIKKVNPAYTSVIGRFKYSKMYGLSVHEAASFVIGRRGLDFEEKIPKDILDKFRSLVKPHLIAVLGSKEESEKASKSGKKKRQFIGMLLKNINTFKEHHSWKIGMSFTKH